jgi:ABC-type nitrate/sulfonate/bicarbonate transport system substrate-binding protein
MLSRLFTRWASISLLVVLALLAAALLAGCGAKKGTSETSRPGPVVTKKITFMAGFKPQANLPFVGVYIAQEKGFFRDQGIDVDLRHDETGAQNLQLLLADQVQITTANGAQVVQRNAQGIPLVALALIGQKSEQGFAVGTSSGITTVGDWAGKTFGYKGSVPTEFLAITKANGLDPGKVKQVRVGFDPRVLSEGQVDVLAVFVSNEPGQLERIGYHVKVFDPSDYGLPALGLTYVATKDEVQRDPEALLRFLKAALKGIDYANSHRDEALDIVLKYAPQENRDQQKFMLNTELDRALTDQTKTNGWGWQTQQQWQALASSLLDFQAIDKPVDVSQVYTQQFLKQAYSTGKLPQ